MERRSWVSFEATVLQVICGYSGSQIPPSPAPPAVTTTTPASTTTQPGAGNASHIWKAFSVYPQRNLLCLASLVLSRQANNVEMQLCSQYASHVLLLSSSFALRRVNTAKLRQVTQCNNGDFSPSMLKKGKPDISD